MKFGLIGMPLSHSWSDEIHPYFIHEPYQKKELEKHELSSFIKTHPYIGLNVTIPYKSEVIPYLDDIDEIAAEIGAVNCIVKKDGKTKGYNTDYLGFADMVKANGWKLKKTAILGSGGASRAVYQAVKLLEGTPVIVSRTPKDTQISYEDLYQNAASFTHIINTTPCGMYPNTEVTPLDLTKFTSLTGVIDIIANPLETKLMFEAKMKGVKTLGGFEMLVRQAAKADELFTGCRIEEKVIRECMTYVKALHQNIVLIGMPSAGKSTLARLLASRIDKIFIDSDKQIEEKTKRAVKDIITNDGEAYFRKIEKEVIQEISLQQNLVIATGGGVIKDEDNMRRLRSFGKVIWIDRDLTLLKASSSRPLSSNTDDLSKLYETRLPLYQKYADHRLINDHDTTSALDSLLAALKGNV